MVFSSLEFLFLFFTATLLLYYAVPKRFLPWRNAVLLAVSLVFYGWSEPKYVLLMVITIAADYVFGWLVGNYRAAGRMRAAKTALILSLVFNLGILGFFKYYDFVVSNLRLIPGMSWLPVLNIGLPIGISFYTFQALSYVIDVYRGDAEYQKNPVAFGTYVTLFPQLVAGPIVRYKDVDDMLQKREETVSLFASGVRTLTAGLAKKVLLANTVGELWNTFSAVPENSRTVLGVWMGIICYTFQIYFDFSAYSDMAIGLGKMIGFRFLENFNYPYISENITEFWRRWHISLSTWFREYVYFPLGGSRCSKLKTYRNLLVVWLLTGFWHGASWNFILWGLYYYVLLVIEKAFLGRLLKKLPSFVSHIYTMLLVIFGWLLFVFEDIGAGFVWLKNMFGIGTEALFNSGDLFDLVRMIPFLIILCVAATPYPKKLFYRLYERSGAFRNATVVACAVLLVISTAFLVDSSFNPFLYTRF